MKLTVQSLSDLFGFSNSTLNPSKARVSDVDVKTLGDKVVLLSWEALSRPHSGSEIESRMTRTYTVIGVVLALILIILQEFFLLLLIGSMLFVRYVLAKVPPEKISYSISTHGISIGEDVYYWPELVQYFFVEDISHVVAVDIKSSSMPRLFISYLPKDKEKIKEILSQHLLFLEQAPKSFLDKTYDGIMSKLSV